MKRPLLVDTDVWIDYLRGHRAGVEFVRNHTHQIVLSPIVVAELYAGARDETDVEHLDDLLGLFQILPLSAEVAKLGGSFRRDYAKSHGVGLADALIAATCVVEHAQMVTLNIRHYPMFKGLKPPYRKS
jgi:predicted nucleic acid-binding protein